MWAQKNCQQSVKIALVRSVKLGAIIQENDASTYTDAAAHLSTRRLGSQVWGEMFDQLGGVSLFHADGFYGLRRWGGGSLSLPCAFIDIKFRLQAVGRLPERDDLGGDGGYSGA